MGLQMSAAIDPCELFKKSLPSEKMAGIFALRSMLNQIWPPVQ
jgi:hypothetical protein